LFRGNFSDNKTRGSNFLLSVRNFCVVEGEFGERRYFLSYVFHVEKERGLNFFTVTNFFSETPTTTPAEAEEKFVRITAASISTVHWVMSLLSAPSEEGDGPGASEKNSESGAAGSPKVPREDLLELYATVLSSDQFWKQFSSKHFLIRKSMYGCVANISRSTNKGKEIFEFFNI
jgi:hypothetical protein